MFKDYYLILGVSNDAPPEEIEKAFKDADKKINVHDIISKDFQDIQEAFRILSNPELKILYDKELEAYNASGNFDNYTIQDSKLADAISSLQGNIILKNEKLTMLRQNMDVMGHVVGLCKSTRRNLIYRYIGNRSNKTICVVLTPSDLDTI